MEPPAAQAVVFDLDGTLVDTVPARIRAWREVLAEHELSADEELLGPMIGMDGRRLAREVAERAGRALDDEAAERIDREAGERFDLVNDPRPLPVATDVLARLDAVGVRWVIATSSRREQVARSVAALGLQVEPRIVDGSRVAHAKPAPDLLLLAARELDADPSGCWCVGDSAWDMRASVAAGMAGIGVLAGSAVDREALASAGARLVIDDLRQLPPTG